MLRRPRCTSPPISPAYVDKTNADRRGGRAPARQRRPGGRLRRRPALGGRRAAGRAERVRRPCSRSPPMRAAGWPAAATRQPAATRVRRCSSATTRAARCSPSSWARRRSPRNSPIAGAAPAMPVPSSGRSASARRRTCRSASGPGARRSSRPGIEAADVDQRHHHRPALAGRARARHQDRRQGQARRRPARRRSATPARRSPGLLLAAALEAASPGEVIALVVLADGADVLLFRAGEAAAQAPVRSVADQLAGGTKVPYGKFLSWRGGLAIEPPRRPGAAPDVGQRGRCATRTGSTPSPAAAIPVTGRSAAAAAAQRR